MDWDHWRFFAAVAYSDDLRRHRFIHCVGDLLASLLYPHLLDAHARRSQNRAPLQAVWRFLKDVVRERQGEWVK